jgi:hypothetical protein
MCVLLSLGFPHSFLVQATLHILLKHATFLTHKIWKWLTPCPETEHDITLLMLCHLIYIINLSGLHYHPNWYILSIHMVYITIPFEIHYQPIWSSPPSSCFSTSIFIKIHTHLFLFYLIHRPQHLWLNYPNCNMKVHHYVIFSIPHLANLFLSKYSRYHFVLKNTYNFWSSLIIRHQCETIHNNVNK